VHAKGILARCVRASSYTTGIAVACTEATDFTGPAVVVAYVPCKQAGDDDGVATGRWPLYRYDPRHDAAVAGGGVAGTTAESADTGGFIVDSERLGEDVQAFLESDRHMSLLSAPATADVSGSSIEAVTAAAAASAEGALVSDAVGARGDDIAAAAEAALRSSYDRLLGAVTLPPLTVLYASDGESAFSVTPSLKSEPSSVLPHTVSPPARLQGAMLRASRSASPQKLARRALSP
jgi:hypothetical protein